MHFPVVILVMALRAWYGHCCQVSPRPIWEKNSLKYRTNSAWPCKHFFKRVWEGNIFCNTVRPNSQHKILTYAPNCPWKKLVLVRKCFSAPLLPLSAKIGDHTATKIPQPTDMCLRPLWVILQNFWPPGNSVDGRDASGGGSGSTSYSCTIQ